MNDKAKADAKSMVRKWRKEERDRLKKLRKRAEESLKPLEYVISNSGTEGNGKITRTLTADQYLFLQSIAEGLNKTKEIYAPFLYIGEPGK